MQTKIMSIHHPKSPEAEAYRTLRTNLQFSSVDEALQVMLITSSNASEGKSTTICNLAASFAQIGKRVLLMEGDLRRPRLHQYLQLPNVKGMTNVLTQREGFQEVVQRTNYDVDVLTCGPIPPNPAELLNSNRLKEVLKTLRENYDIILIDTPPVGVVTDAAILATLVDGVMLVVASGQTDSDLALRSIKLLENVGARLLGCVLTKVAPDSKGYYGYQYYEYSSEESQKRHKKRKRRLR